MDPVLTKNIVSKPGTVWIEDYEKNGGYRSFQKALKMSPSEVVQLVTESGLRGRGGAGFPTGKKWSSVLPIANSIRPRYLACNFDEMEPGTFKDRFLGQHDPHQLLEGLLIAGYACQLDVGYIFVRLEYLEIAEILKRAIGEAKGRGYIGENVLSSGWTFDVRIHTSAGRYMAGEETGLLNALEGKPANPRSKPPYPGTSGAWGRPTVVQNVETLSCVPHIVEHGAEWFRSLGKAKDAGTKIYGASGKVKTPGCWELPMGSTLREIIEERAGGMREGLAFRAALPGGASTRFMDSSQLDVPLDFDTLKEHGLFLGTGTAIVLDDKTCPVAACHNLQMFYSRESCGWCTPCREGLPWIEKILRDIENGLGQPGDVEDLLIGQGNYLGPNTYCALATGAMFPLLSAIEKFRDDFEEHIRIKGCPYKH
jgi:NADH-quinone oxidoreductase subunit F